MVHPSYIRELPSAIALVKVTNSHCLMYAVSHGSPIKAKFHYAIWRADRFEAGRRHAASRNLAYHLARAAGLRPASNLSARQIAQWNLALTAPCVPSWHSRNFFAPLSMPAVFPPWRGAMLVIVTSLSWHDTDNTDTFLIQMIQFYSNNATNLRLSLWTLVVWYK